MTAHLHADGVSTAEGFQNEVPVASGENQEQPLEHGKHKSKLWRALSLQAFKTRKAKKGGSTEDHEPSPPPLRRSLSITRKRAPSKPNQVVNEEAPLPPVEFSGATEPMKVSADVSNDVICTPPAGAEVEVEPSQKGLVPRMLGLLKNGLAATGDLTKLQVPPQFNMAKSQLQLYGEAIYACDQVILNSCTQGATPLDRLLAVIRWHLSTVRSPLFGKAPYNPIEGETHHVSAGGLHLLGEQVSHHPPISAVYACNPSTQTRVLWQHSAAPRFTGSSVEVAIKGRRRLFLDAHNEVYELESPNLGFRFLPTPLAQWTGQTRVVCEASGLAAVVHFKGKGSFWGKGQGVSGKVGRMGPDRGIRKGEEIGNIEGHWDGLVYYSDKGNKKAKTLLYDSAAALASLQAPQVVSPSDVSKLESCCVWAPLSKALLASDWETARKTKKGIEEKQRRIRRERELAGGSFAPVYFVEEGAGEWVWKGPRAEVDAAPLICR